MKRVAIRANEPAVLVEFRTRNPNGTWSQFRNRGRNREVFAVLAAAQGHVCAYCEQRIGPGGDGQVEHVEPKANRGDVNLHLAFDNMLAACRGGVDRPTDATLHPITETMHCGAKKADTPPKGQMLDPRTLPASPCLWIARSTGRLEVDRAACEAAGVDPDLAERTLDFLGLNRRSLVRRRETVLAHLESTAQGGDPTEVALSMLDLGSPELPPFWSTIRSWGGPAVEPHIDAHRERIPGLA